MTLDQHAQGVLDWLKQAGGRDVADGTVEQARQDVLGFVKMQAPAEEVAEVRDLQIPGPAGPIPARYYRPADAAEPAPVLVIFHGGGYVIGDLEIMDRPCRMLANRVGAVVVSVDYRLAPEHPFPAGPEDCYAATKWVSEHAAELGADPARLAVGGDSAGGNLSAVVCQMAADRGGPAIAHQLLIYPSVNSGVEYPSHAQNAEGYMLTKRSMEWFGAHYSKPEDDASWLRSPIRGSLAGLPPATIITAGYDPLRDEGTAYADALRDAGVEVELLENPGMFHGFMWLTGAIPHAVTVYDQIGERLRVALG